MVKGQKRLWQREKDAEMSPAELKKLLKQAEVDHKVR